MVLTCFFRFSVLSIAWTLLLPVPTPASAGLFKGHQAKAEFKGRLRQQTEHVEALRSARGVLNEQVAAFDLSLRGKHSEQLARRETVRQRVFGAWKLEGLLKGDQIIRQLLAGQVTYSGLPGGPIERQMIQDILELKVESYQLALIERESAQYAREETVMEVHYIEALQKLDALKDEESTRDPAMVAALAEATRRDAEAWVLVERETRDEEELADLIAGLARLTPELREKN